MYKILHFVLYFSFGSLMFSCKSNAPSNQQKYFEEDLKSFRPTYAYTKPDSTIQLEEEAQLSRNHNALPTGDEIADAMTSLENFRRNYAQQEFVSGFRVLIYSGTDRAYANELIDKVQRDFHNNGIKEYLDLQYQPPTFKIFVGYYPSRLAAYEMISKINTFKELEEEPILVVDKLPRESVEAFYLGKTYRPKK